MPLVQVGHPSPLVTRGLVAMWSQFQANVARQGVWQHTGSGPYSSQSTRFKIWCSGLRRGREGPVNDHLEACDRPPVERERQRFQRPSVAAGDRS
jgi:hypothetical protein